MAKGRKKTKGVLGASVAGWKPPTPDQMLESSARSMMRDAVECSPSFKSAVGKLKGTAKKLARGVRTGGDKSEA